MALRKAVTSKAVIDALQHQAFQLKSPMLKCINDSFQSDSHSQCSWSHCTGLLSCDPCALLKIRAVTHLKLIVTP